MTIRFLIFLFLVTSSGQTLAGKKSIGKLRDKISNQSGKINKLAAQIKDIDLKISTTNDSYLDRMKEIGALEIQVEVVKKDLLKTATDISKDYKLTKIAFDYYILESTDSDSDDSLEVKKLYLELLKKKLGELASAQSQSNKLLSVVHQNEEEISQKKRDEEDVYQLIIDLENKKKDISQNYVSLMEKQNLNQDRLDKFMAKSKAVAKVYKSSKKTMNVPFRLKLPLDTFTSAKRSKEGIILKYSETTPIKSPGPGRVVYAGELASYGKVLIIDHGQDVKSVLLGDMVAKVAKGDNVIDNQVLGYTIAEPGATKSLYYEIRKKSIAQNTIQWLSSSKKIKL